MNTSMVDVVRDAGYFVLGLDNPKKVAERWEQEGFTPETANDWIQVGAWDPKKAAKMLSVGITPQKCRQLDDNLAGSCPKVATLVCNGDLTLDKLNELIQSH